MKETPALVFSCEYCEIFKNTYFEGDLPAGSRTIPHRTIAPQDNCPPDNAPQKNCPWTIGA